MKLEVINSDTGEKIILNDSNIIFFNLVPENESEKEGMYWGSRMSVRSFIKQLENTPIPK